MIEKSVKCWRMGTGEDVENWRKHPDMEVCAFCGSEGVEPYLSMPFTTHRYDWNIPCCYQLYPTVVCVNCLENMKNMQRYLRSIQSPDGPLPYELTYSPSRVDPKWRDEIAKDIERVKSANSTE